MNSHVLRPVFEELVPAGAYSEGLVDDSNGLSVFLTHVARPQEVLCVYFYAYYAYQNTNESYRHELARSLAGRSATMFTASASSWIDWLSKESGGLLAELPLLHFILVTADDVIDVATKHQPTLTWLSRESFVAQLALRRQT